MSDLARFLLARIEEAEAAAVVVHQTDPECAMVFHARVDPGFGWTCDCGVPERIASECAAKRRIIELARDVDVKIDGEWGGCRSHDEIWIGDRLAGRYLGWDILLQLAEPYRSHPSFDASWLLP